MAIKKNEMNWLVSHSKVEDVLDVFDIREFTEIKAVVLENGNEVELKSFTKMVEYDNLVGLMVFLNWAQKVIDDLDRFGKNGEYSLLHVYFRFIRVN